MNALTKQQKASRRAKNHRRYEAKKAKRGTKTQKSLSLKFNARQQEAFGLAVLGLVQKMKAGRR